MATSLMTSDVWNTLRQAAKSSREQNWAAVAYL
jgi:hypothetical protein